MLIETRGRPGMIVSDHGTEFTSNAILGWAIDQQVAWHNIAPGKAVQNTFVESFRPAARRTPERDAVPLALPRAHRARGLARYNTIRPHSRLGWLTAQAYAATRRFAALRSTNGSTPRAVAITAQEASVTGRHQSPLDKNWGQRQRD